MRKISSFFLFLIFAFLANVVDVGAQTTSLLNENFNSITSGVPTGWDNSDNDCGSSYAWQSDASGYNSTRGMKFNTYSASSGTYSTLKTPVLNLNMDYILRFKYNNYNAGDLQVFISLDGGTSYTTSLTGLLTSSSTSEWNEEEISLSAYTGQTNVKIVFKGISNWGSYRQYLDDVVIESAPTCKSPTDFYVSNLSTTSADLNWGYTVDGDQPGTLQLTVTDENGTTVISTNTISGAATSTSYTMTGLSANTTYVVSMRGDCDLTGGGYSKYGTFTFTTACNPSTVPYTENFDALSGIPDCTSSLNATIESGTKYGSSGKSLKLTASSSEYAYMIFPLISHTANDIEMTFFAKSSISTTVPYKVGIVTDPADIEGSFYPVRIDSMTQNSSWEEIRLNTSAAPYQSSTVMMCIYLDGGKSASMYIDNVSIHAIPSCVRPEQFRAYNPTANSIDISWTTSTASQHLVDITTGGTTTQVTASTNPFTITGLQPNTQYTIGIRAYCGAGDTSEYASASVSAKTLCLPLSTTVWSEGAESTSGSDLPDCWSYGFFNRPSSGTTYDQPFITQSSTKHTGSRAFQLRDMSSGTLSYLSSPGFPIDSANKYQASIWVYRLSGASYNGEGIHLYASNTPDDISNAQDLGLINRYAGNSPAETGGTGWYQYSYPISLTGTVYLIIEGVSQYGSSTSFDDISVGLAPTCLVPGDVAIGTATMSDVAITWSAGTSNETSWVLAYELMSGSTVVSSDSLTVTTPSYTVTGLAAASSYTLRARVYAVCSPTDMSAAKSTSSSFTTPCATITTLPYSQDFEAMTANTIPTCWDNSSSTSTASSSYYIWGVYSYSNNNMIRMYNYLVHDGDALINTPTIVLPTQAAELQFDYSNKASSGDLYVKISTDNGTTFTNLGSYPSSGSYSQTVPTFTHETIDLSSYAGQSVIIQFYVEADYGSGAVFVDNVLVRLSPTCRDIVGGATVYDISTNSARVSITDATATSWDISYGTSGTAAGLGTIINVTGRMDTILTGLVNNTTYDVYVRRNCGATDLGAWTISPVSFTCSCTAATATISQVNARDAVVTANVAEWELCYGPSGTTTTTGTIVPVSGSTSFSLTGLTPSTIYVAYVRHNCGNSEYSDWSSAYNFQTTSIPDSLPFGTGFESSADDGGWHIVNGTYTTNVFTIGTDANAVCSGSRALYMSTSGSYGYSTSSATKTYAYRTIYFPSGTTHISFNWKCTGGESSWDFGRVMLVPASETLTGGTGSSYSSTTFPAFIRSFDPAGANKMNLATGDANGWNLYEADIALSTDSAGTYNFVVMWNNDGSAGSNYPIAIDNISISQVTCNVPTVLASALTSNGGTVTAISQETQNVEIVVSSTPIDIYGTVTGDLYQGITTAPVVITTMQPNTAFYYTARAICGAGDTSRWAAVQSARTACAAMSVPYTENFDDADALSCWTSSGTVTPSRNTQYHYSGTASYKINDGAAISPELNVQSLSTYMLTGQVYATSDSVSFAVGVVDDPSDFVGTYEELGQVTVPTRNTWTEFTTYFTNIVDFPTAKHFAITAGSDATIYIDDLYLGVTPTCPKPTEISITNVLSNSCQVAWTNNATSAQSWIIKATPTTAGAQTITQVVTTNPVTISGLNAASSYSISMAAICSATDTSLWAQGGTITTACAIVNAPYSEDFESQTLNQTPNCWDISGSTTTTATSTPAYVWGVYATGGNQMIRMYNYYVQSGYTEITSPIIALTAGNNYELRFDYCNQSSSGSLAVDLSTNGGTTWNNVGSYSGASGDEDIPSSWTTISYGLSAYSGSNIMLRFSNTANYGYGSIFVDNVKVRQLRNCLDIASISANIGANDASFTISDTVATHTQWQYMYGAAGFDTTGITPTLISADTFSVTGLTSSTNYTVYVRAYCDATEQSNWTIYNFKTTSQPAAFPYVCHFNDATENNQWQFLSSTGPNAFTIGTDAAALAAGENAALYISNDNSTYTYSYSYSSSTASTSQAVAYRLFRFSPSQYTIHFTWKCTGGESNWDYARFYLLPASTQPTLPPSGSYSASAWPSNVIALDGGTWKAKVTSPEWNTVDMTLDMTSQSGSYYLVFNWVNDGSGGTASYPLAVNDIEIDELTCTSPVVTIPAATITTNSAVINYTVADTSATVRYWYNTTGSRTDTTNITTAASSPITLTGLSASSNYYFFMRTECSATDHSPIAANSFKTSCGAISAFPYTEGFEDTEFAPNCWSTVDGDDVAWDRYTTSYSSSNYIHNGSASATVDGTGTSYYSSGTAMLSTPQFLFDSLREYSVKFYMYRSTYTYNDNLKVYLSNSPSSVTSATLLGTVTVGSAASSGMQEISYDLPTYTKGTKYIVFKGEKVNYYGSYIYIDDVTVDVYPTCRDLSAPATVESTTATTMTVSAVQGPNHQGIIFAYAPATATSVADTIGSVYSTTGTAVITGLSNSTTYKVYARGVCSATDSTVWTAAVSGTTMATDCFQPQNMHVVGLVGATAATIAWGGAPEAIGYECQLNGVSVDTVTTDTVYLQNLTPSTSYVFRARTFCLTDTSAWVSVSFTTTSMPATLPYICDFEDAVEANQWELLNGSQTNAFAIGTATSNGGSTSLYISNDQGSTYAYTNTSSANVFATRFFQLQAGQYAYSYDWNCYGESNYDYGRVFLAPDNITLTPGTLPSGVGTTGVPSGCYEMDGNSKLNQVSAWQNKSGILTLTEAGNYLLVVLWHDDSSVGTNPPLAIDNVQFTMLTCPQPTISVIASSLGETSAAVEVDNPNTSDTVIYAVSLSTVDQAIFTDTVVGQDTIYLTGLSGSTGYNVFVKVHCGENDESFWSSASFRTTCGVTTLPYTEGFETISTTYTDDMIESICWNDLGASTSTSSWSNYPNYRASTSSSYVTEGTQCLQLVSSNSSSLYLIMPPFGNIGNCRVTYDATYESTSSSGIIYTGYITDVTDGNTFVAADAPTRSTSLQSYTADVANIPAGARIAFKYGDAGSSNFWAWIDNVRVSQLVQGDTYYDTICHNSPYTNHGFNVQSSDLQVGDNVLTRTKAGSSGNPDTIFTANVYQRDEIENVSYDTLCQGQPLIWAGLNIQNPVSRRYQRTGFTSVTGCDSSVVLYLTVVPTYHTVFDTICQGDAYNTAPFTGRNLTVSGFYTATSQSPYGCTDTTGLNLYVVPTSDTIYQSICNGDSYQWHGQTYRTSGTFTWTGTGSHGCPRTERLILNVIQNDSTIVTSFCKGGQVLVVDTIIKTAGNYTITRFDYVIGCNVTYHITVTEDPISQGTATDYTCQDHPYYGFGISGEYLTKDTTVSFNTKTFDGKCDSLVVATITFVATVRGTTEEVSINAGETYNWHDQTYYESGYYYDTIQSAATGCDSICTLKLTVGGVEPQGVEDVQLLNISLIPNPVNAGETSFIYGNFTNVRSVEVLNSFGQVIDTFVPETYPIEVSGVTASGIYYVRVLTDDDKVAVQKLIVR